VAERDQVVSVDYLAAVFRGQVLARVADEQRQLGRVESHDSPGHHVVTEIGQLHDVACLEVAVYGGDAGR
jgi:hypothetical protein